jgi:hypothetical protein
LVTAINYLEIIHSFVGIKKCFLQTNKKLLHTYILLFSVRKTFVYGSSEKSNKLEKNVVTFHYVTLVLSKYSLSRKECRISDGSGI